MVFILGISQRCGTNYLSDLITLHPDILPSRKIPEEYLISSLPAFKEAVVSLRSKWQSKWIEEFPELKALEATLGRTLFESLSRTGDRAIFKTPRTRGLEWATDFFPDAKFLILVRDGRDVAVSYANTWREWTIKKAAKFWLDEAEYLLGMRQIWNEDERFKLLRYEDLVSDPDKQLSEIYHFLGVKTDAELQAKPGSLPVRGSSQFATDDWSGVDSVSEFNPVGRYKSLSLKDQRMLNKLLSSHLKAFGYEVI